MAAPFVYRIGRICDNLFEPSALPQARRLGACSILRHDPLDSERVAPAREIVVNENGSPFALASGHAEPAPGRHPVEQLRYIGAVGALMVAAGFVCLIHALMPRLMPGKAERAVTRLKTVLDRRTSADEAMLAAGDVGGMLTLLALSVATALIPWFGQANVGVALSFSLVSLALPAAAFRAAATDWDQADTLEETPAWPKLWTPERTAPPPRPHPPLRDIVVIGGGFSGTMLAVHLMRTRDVRVTLIERQGAPGRGIAYSTANPGHLLNVRAERMSAYPEDPGHFARWLAARGLGAPSDFAPRRVYGLYLEQQLRQAHADAFPRLKLLSAEAQALELDGPRRTILLDDGRRIPGDAIVLASGNPPPPRLAAFAGLPAHLYCADPRQEGLAEGLGKDDVVLLVGTGLTMVDTALALADAGFEGRIIAMSRRGLVPRVHGDAPHPAGQPATADNLPLSQRLAALRARAADVGWRTAMDELRPQTQGLWKALGDVEKSRFLRHLRPWWDVHRHRLAPEIAGRLDALRAAGRFETAACRIVGAEPRYGRVAVSLRPRGSDEIVRIEAARVVNCTGSDEDLRRTRDPLLRDLLTAGAIRPDAHRLGLQTGTSGEAIGANGRPTPGLFALGPLARGRLWEATAVPELRAQAAAMAAVIAAEAHTDANALPA
jgi:uncharacterized NAD(P)/FAD-binding protein YdhS